MANYFSKYTGRKGPAIAPGIIEMMGSIGEEYGKGIEKFGEGIANYKKNKAEKNKAEADFENALSRMSGLYGEESIIYSVDDKIMSKLESGKGTKEDFLSAFNSLNTMEDSIEENREREEKIRQFGVTTGQRERQIEATTALGHRRITSGETIAEGGWASAEDIAAGGIASREGMQDKDLTARAAEGAADRTSRKQLQQAQITSTEGMHGERLAQDKSQFFGKLDQDFFLEMNRLDLTDKEIDQRYTIHTESAEQAWNLAQDTLAQKDRHHAAVLTETKRINQIRENVDARIKESQQAGLVGYSAYTDKTQTTFDPDAHSAAMSGAGSLGGPTPAQLQSYMDTPEQFQRQTTVSERAVKALQTPNLSLEVQADIAKMANMDAGTGGVKFVQHPETGAWVAVGPKGSMSQLPTSRKSATELRIEFDMLRDKARGIKDDQKRLDYLTDQKMKQIGVLRAGGVLPEEEEYKEVVDMWDSAIHKQRERMGGKGVKGQPTMRFDASGNEIK